MFLKIYPFILVVLLVGIKLSIVWFFCSAMVLVVISPLPFLILFFWDALSLFSWWELKVYQFFYLFKKPALVSLSFSIIFLVCIWFICFLIFIISFLLLTLVFGLLFLIPSGGRLGFLFAIFLVFWCRRISL